MSDFELTMQKDLNIISLFLNDKKRKYEGSL